MVTVGREAISRDLMTLSWVVGVGDKFAGGFAQLSQFRCALGGLPLLASSLFETSVSCDL